jgi:UPF0716 family protein affecting phage T7 exclusion
VIPPVLLLLLSRLLGSVLLRVKLLLTRVNLHRLSPSTDDSSLSSSVLSRHRLLLLLLGVELLQLLRRVLRLLSVLLLWVVDRLLGLLLLRRRSVLSRRGRRRATGNDGGERLARLTVVGELGVGWVEGLTEEEGVGVDDLLGGGEKVSGRRKRKGERAYGALLIVRHRIREHEVDVLSEGGRVGVGAVVDFLLDLLEGLRTEEMVKRKERCE